MAKMPEGDRWKLMDNDVNSQYHNKFFWFDFSNAVDESVKSIVKSYAWRNYVEGNKSLCKLKSEVINFKHFNSFMALNGITSFKNLTNNEISRYISYLRTLISHNTMRPLSYIGQKICLDTVKSIIRWGQLYLPDQLPNTEIFTGHEYMDVNMKLKIDFIPDDIIARINMALKSEAHPFIKYGVIILEATGMRIGDMLKLTVDCLKPHPISGMNLYWYDHKNRKERQPLPITDECALAVKTLIEYTADLRLQTAEPLKKYIFIHKTKYGDFAGQVMNISPPRFNEWLKGFIKKNDIRDSNGELFKLSAHKFRRTLGTDMFSKGIDLSVIKDVLGTHIQTVKSYYADVKDINRAETFKQIGIIGNINLVDERSFPNSGELVWFMANKDKGARMCDGYCTKPVKKDDICDRLLKRQKCFTCSRYITTPEYLETHKSYLKELETQIENNIYGEHYASHFKSTAAVLKEIVKRLEEIQDVGSNVATTNPK